MKRGPVYVNGQRVVRIRNHYPDIGIFRVHVYVVTDTHGRKNLAGFNFISYEKASQWVAEQGWRHIGRQTEVKPAR